VLHLDGFRKFKLGQNEGYLNCNNKDEEECENKIRNLSNSFGDWQIKLDVDRLETERRIWW